MKRQKKIEYDAIVIGGGISGILISLALSKEGKNVLVIEKDNIMGGNCRTYEVDGYHVDTGPHAITNLLNGPLRELIKKYFTVIPRFFPINTYYVRDQKKFQEFPLTLRQLAYFDILPKRERLIMSGAMIDAVANSSLNKNVLKKSVYDYMKKYNPSEKTLKLIDAVSYFLSGKSMKETPTWRMLGGSGYVDENNRKEGHLKKFIKFAKHNYSSQGYPLGGIQSITDCALNSMQKKKVVFKLNEKVIEFIIENNTIKGVKTNKDIYFSSFVVYSGFMKDLPSLTDNLDKKYRIELLKLKQTKSLTLWLGLKKKLPEISYIGSEMYFDTGTPYWAVPVSNFDPYLAPKNKQLIGSTTVIENENFAKKANKLRNSIFKAIPNIKDCVEFEHTQITIPEKAAVTVGIKFPSPRSPIKGLYLVGTDTDMRSMGITRASYSVVEALKFMEEDGFLGK
ncbi:MAG: NAD(P)/FAD-dependent oxidoreductase [Candidatus Pacebacteria bacterium]|nr:NAD(P)/FAD-dependent oxidoreductase [Candidatus Paceibacterota bacterium]